MNDILSLASLAISAIAVILLLIVLVLTLKNNNSKSEDDSKKAMEDLKTSLQQQQRDLRQEISQSTQQSVKSMGDMIALNQQNFSQNQSEKMAHIEERLKTFSLENEQKLDLIRKSVETRLTYMQEDNNKQLEKMRVTVDEKLQKTLEDKMNKSFSLVNDRLEQVYKGLGEMQNLAVGGGDLKKVLSNVKTRGI